MIMLAHDDADFSDIVNNALMVTPDGMPLKWFINLRGGRLKDRVYGPTLSLHICEAARSSAQKIGLYGGRTDSVITLRDHLLAKYPGLDIAFVHSPPFRELSTEEESSIIDQINAAGIRILFVGLGCPKQERWMAKNRTKINGVCIGVGAFFDFYSGRVKQAPAWMQKCGLEWLFRLSVEPRRLWRRYLYYNPRFLVLVLLQLLYLKKFPAKSTRAS